MERSLHRDHLVSGNVSRRSFGLGSSKVSLRNSDVDFNDVFGGPPRRSLVQDWCYSLGEAVDSGGVGDGGGEEMVCYRDPWTGLSEKPVFGEGSLNRRRRQTNEFYDDIFRGDGSLDSTSTPKKLGSDVFSSTPPSRVLSPARPLPPQPEAMLGSSLPSVFSLRGKLAKEIDFSSSASPHRSPQKNKAGDFIGNDAPISSSTFTSRSSTHAFPGEDGLRNDSRPFYRQSSLSKEFSFNSILSPKSNLSEANDREGIWKKKSVLSGNDSGNQFHFSIYKWASKGVPIAMLLQGRNGSRAKGSAKVMNAGTEEPAPCSQDIDLSSVGENNLEKNESCKFSRELQSTSSAVVTNNKERTDSFENDKEVLVAAPESKSATNLQRMTLDTPCDILPHSAKSEIEVSFGAPLDAYSSRGTMREKSNFNKELRKSELKPLHMLFNDESTTQGDVNAVGKHRLKEGKVKSTKTSVQDVDGNEKVNKGAGSERNQNLKKESNSSLQYSPADSEEKLVSNKFKGKVKEFVKIFNQEAPEKSMKSAESGSQRFGVRERSIGKGGEANVGATRGDMKKRLTSSSVMVHQTPKDSAKPPLNSNSKSYKIDETSYEWERSSISCSGSTPESFESGIGFSDLEQSDNIEKSDSADLFCQVEELSHEKETQPQIAKTTTMPQSQIAKNQEIIQDSDARIKKWSTGKEGNIRSLLSTLQYVLWPESGWKPLPLVDIIEGNSVKRAYQKALLCLHPDKLQQKGAAAHQKYIAEKVFDILQEAWTHFISLGSF